MLGKCFFSDPQCLPCRQGKDSCDNKTMRKVYVDVEVRWKRDGVIIPTALWWEQGRDEWERYDIDEVLAGPYPCTGQTFSSGMCYDIRIGHSKRYLFLEKDKWFLEVNR